MSALPQSVRERAIKIAAAELVGMLGGQESAAGIIDKSQSHVQRCCSVDDIATFFNTRDIGVLEAHAGQYPVTAELAKQAGGVFLQLPDPALCDDGALALQVVRLADELGDVSSALRKAMAKNGIDQHELQNIEDELDHLVAAAVEGRALVQVMRGGTPVAIPITSKRAGE